MTPISNCRNEYAAGAGQQITEWRLNARKLTGKPRQRNGAEKRAGKLRQKSKRRKAGVSVCTGTER